MIKYDYELIDKLRKKENPVIIFGAGIVGEVLFHACKSLGINVDCFCDNNINKTTVPWCGKKVIHTSKIKTLFENPTFLLSAADLKDVVEQLQELGYQNWYSGNIFLRTFDLSSIIFSVSLDFIAYAVATCLLCHDSFLHPDKLFLRSVDIVITERCSLKCRDCSNLMQYYEKPNNYHMDELIKSTDALCNLVDEINEFRVIGGEPFMNKNFHIIVEQLIQKPNVKKIVIYTNGTIVPKEFQLNILKNPKVLILITDYDLLSKKLNLLTQVLNQHHIFYFIQKVRGWTDCAKIIRHFRTSEQEEIIFKNCCAKNTVTLMNGKLFRCPFSANAFQLHAVPNYKDDYIQIDHLTKENIFDAKKKLRAFLLEKKSLKTCDFCNGRSFDDPEILPAVQTKQTLPYKNYSDSLLAVDL